MTTVNDFASGRPARRGPDDKLPDMLLVQVQQDDGVGSQRRVQVSVLDQSSSRVLFGCTGSTEGDITAARTAHTWLQDRGYRWVWGPYWTRPPLQRPWWPAIPPLGYVAPAMVLIGTCILIACYVSHAGIP